MHNAKRPIALLLVLCFLLSVLPVSAQAVSISTKPANGTTEGQPFAAGTGGSANFRIPGIVTLDNGTLIAACDARWNHAGDGAGLDTIVSVSTDNGETWTYTFANYLGDNGDTYNNLSTCFIDPGIGTDGTTAYLIADLWPAGIALNTSKYSPVAGENGFDDNNNLLLRDVAFDTVTIGGYGYNTMAANASYDYYLDLDTLTLHKEDGTLVEGYTVDAYFNIKGNGVDTNLFFSDSPYQPYPTDYLYMTTSTDGLNWSEPELLNLKEESEQTLLVGPGNGTYDAQSGRMVFTAYEHSSGYERTSLIWMDANGNWSRSEDATASNWSSEASAVILDDGTVRVFYRDGFAVLRYTDYVFDESVNNYVVSAREVSTTAPKDTGCQLTAIKYSEQIDGKDVILVATPTTSRRVNGYIYAFLVSEDNSMELAYAYNVTPDFYAYSCLTELEDGRIGLLYESASSAITFVSYDFEDIANRDNDPRLTVKEIELNEGFSQTITDNSGYYVNADISELDTDVATLTMTGEEVTTNAAQVLSNGANIDLDTCQYTFTATEDGYYEVSATTLDGETVYLNHFSTTNNNIPNVTAPVGKIAILESAHQDMFKLQAQIIEGGSGAARGLHFHTEAATPYWNRCGNDSSVKCHEYLYRKAGEGDTASTEIPGYVRITSLDEIVDGGKYLIAAKNDAGNWFVLNPSVSTDKWGHVAQIAGSTTVGYTELTFTGVGKGYTEVVVGSTIYKLTVHGADDIYLDVGESITVTDDTGYFVDADLSMLDTSVATVELTGEITGYEKLLSENVAEIVSGKSYVLYNKAARKLMSNEWADASVGGGGSDGLSLDSTVNAFEDNDIWTITAAEGGWYVQDLNGDYLSIARGKGLVRVEPVVIDLDFDGSDWTIGENGEYANDFGGAHTAVAGWSDINDVNSQWEIYEVSSIALGTTTITFTGVGEGVTSVQIGDALYEITVTEPYVDPADDSRDIPLEVLEVSTGDYEKNGMQYNEGPAYFAVDNDPNSLWHTDWYGTSRENHWFQFELTDTYSVDGLRYQPRQAGNTNGTITEYEIQVSDDGENFRTVASGEWEGDRSWKLAKFDGETVKYVRLVAIDALTDNQYVFASASEIRLTGVKTDAPEHEHQYEAVVTEPTCTEGGYTTYTCECGDSYVADETPALGHSAGESVVENEVAATCTEDGSYESVVYCSVCGVEISRETVTVDALGHDYKVKEIVPPTCTKSGYTVYECSRCGKTYKDDPVEPEHQFDEGTVTAPTCTELGYTTYTCLKCGFEYVDEASWVPALGHTAGEAVVENEVAATCTEDGSYESVVYCTVCGVEISRETITVPALPHTEEIIPGKEATCTETGLTEGKKCSVCGEVLVAQEVIPALGHTEAEPVIENEVAPDCVTDGSYDSVVYCSVCGVEVSRETVVVPALGHDFVNGECSRCDAVKDAPFTDVPVGEFYFDPVEWAVEKGITTGASETTFNPGDNCLRGHVVTFLWRAAGSPEPTSNENPFSDVTENDFFYKAVLWAVENEITNGISATKFGPYTECNRAQVVTFLWRAQGKPTVTETDHPFTDVDADQFYYQPMLWAVENGITNGLTATTFGPGAVCNRAQVVTFLYRTMA